MKRHKGEKNVNAFFTETNYSKCEVSYQPLCIVEQILVKLPIKYVLRCKGVCKSWYNLITGPNFSKLYVKNSSFTWILGSRKRDIESLYLLEIEGTNVDVIRSPLNPKRDNSGKTEVLEVVNLCTGICCCPERFILKGPYVLEVVASCNGLCCFIERYRIRDSDYTKPSPNVILCNPITGERVELPNGNVHATLFAVYEICFNPSTGRYTIVRIMDQLTRDCWSFTLGQIFTLGVDKNWRNIEDLSFPSQFGCSSVYFNGIFHFLGFHWTGSVFIYALNVEEEKGRCFSCPPGLSDKFHHVTVLDDHLSLVSDPNDSQIDLWVMKEYGVAESWTKKIILKDWISPTVSMKLLKDGWRLQFCIYSYNDLFAVDQKDKYDMVRCKFFPCLTYVPCFSSLKDIMSERHDDT